MGRQSPQQTLMEALRSACSRVYGDRLVSLVVFGSYGRGTMRPDSDLDCLLIAEGLPEGRIARVEEFGGVERAMGAELEEALQAGIHAELSPHFKTPEEAARGSVLYLDMTQDASILHDREGFFSSILDAQRERLERLGARRIWQGSRWYWDLKPDYRPGMVFEL